MNPKVTALIKKVPIFGEPLRKVYYSLFNIQPFTGSREYWEQRYQSGGTSGPGSYNRLAEYKAEILNVFVADNGINSVIELGCGDGNQLSLARYPAYIGLDVSSKALEMCKLRFEADRSKSFFLYDPFSFVDNQNVFCADLAISLDVLFHLVEDDIYATYLKHLFHLATRYVIIYSSNYDSPKSYHQRHRKFSMDVEKNFPVWHLIKVIKNRYPYNEDDPANTSFCDFYIFQKAI